MKEGLVSRLPDAAVVFERAGSLLTLQAELNGTWIVFFLQEKTVKMRLRIQNHMFGQEFFSASILKMEAHEIQITIILMHFI